VQERLISPGYNHGVITMPILYIDDYRGFQDTYIPLKDVNFFVGENSTGKTSIISLIKILNSFSFWFFTSFNTEEITLGQFDEIVTTGKKSFKIGFLNGNSKLFPTDAVYMSFINHEGLPSVSEYAYIDNNYNIKIKINLNDKIKYKVDKIEKDFVKISDSVHSFKQWIDHMKTLKRGFNISKNEPDDKLRLFRTLSQIEEEIIEKEIIPKNDSEESSFFHDGTNWIAPIRAKPKRIYESYNVRHSPEGEHSANTLRKMLSEKSDSDGILSKIIFPFGEKSGLFKRIELKNLGTGDLSPYEINIVLDNQPFKISNVGYGVSQILPILVDTAIDPNDEWFLIQQPEIHLHPKAQAAIGELIYDIHVIDNKNFIIETHSEYLINRFRIRLKEENRSNNPQSQVLFFERTDTGNRVHAIEIQNNGKYSEDMPDSFSDFFIQEDLRLLEI
jgi:predicted ATPase